MLAHQCCRQRRGRAISAGLALASVVVHPLGALLTTPLAAQAPAAAAEAINATDVARHVGVLTADSMTDGGMRGRGLERMARYIAEQFKKLGVSPNGDKTPRVDSTGQVGAMDTSYFQYYPLPGQLKISGRGSQLTLVLKLRTKDKIVVDEGAQPVEQSVMVSFERDAYFGADTVPQSGARGHLADLVPPTAFVFAGPQTLQTVRRAKLENKLAIYVPPAGTDAATRQQIVEFLWASNNVLVVSDDDSVTFAARRNAVLRRPIVVVDQYMEDALGILHWAAHVRAEAVKRVFVGEADLAALWATTTPTIRELPTFRATMQVGLEPVADTVKGLNVIGFIPGTDSVPSPSSPPLSGQHIIYSVNMDQTGGTPNNAVGLAGLLELAKAYSRPGARPKRSVLFVATSGGATDQSGANYFVVNAPGWGLEWLALDIKLGTIGRRSHDSVTVAGLGDLELAARPGWIAAQHPELQLAVADGGSIASSTGDQLAFVRKAVPSLYFYNGQEADQTGAAGASIDADHAARIAQLAFYVGEAIANGARRPRWTQAGRGARVKSLGQ